MSDQNQDQRAQDPLSKPLNENVKLVNLEEELKQSFIDYAMSVIVDRALPDVRDGLKPVHRRVLFDMYDLKVWHTGQTKKSARIVGDVIGRFHPHGDVAVYDTIVRMTQWFSMREPLIFGQGNFGDIDGDGAAAMRYTEVKMNKIAELMLADIDKDTVNTYPNYDGNEQIPEVLPTRFPNLLVNGSSGIAVGMATNIPPHNLMEVIDGSLALLDNPDITLDELMKFIPGPDFPTGGIIVGNDGIRQAYATGKGRCVIRSRTHLETDKSGRQTIYVDEIPYVVHKIDIVKQISSLVREKKIEGIAEVNDLSDKDNPVRIAIDLKRDAFPEAVLNNLYQSTLLQSSFAINMVALVHNHPRLLSLKEILTEFVKFRREVVTRRTVFLLRQDRRKAHIDEGLMVAKANIQRVIDLITSSENQEDARQKLMAEPWSSAEIAPLIERTAEGVNISLPQGIPEECGLHGEEYFLSTEQAKAILALQLSRLTHLAQDEIRNDYQELLVRIKDYLEILNQPARMRQVIREELLAVRNEYNDKRRTSFTVDLGKFDKSELIARQDVIVTMSSQGYVKYQDIATYESQHRGGYGRAAAKLKDEDYITNVVVTNTHDRLLCFTSQGRMFVTIVYDLPTSENRTWRGRSINNLFNIEEQERITALLPISDFDSDTYIFMATKLGRVKKIRCSDLKSFVERNSSNALKILTLLPGDELIGVDISGGDDDIFLFSSDGRCLRFCEYYANNGSEEAVESDSEAQEGEPAVSEGEGTEAEIGIARHSGDGVRPSGRGSGTIKGIRLSKGATVVSLLVVAPTEPNHMCLIVTDKGFGKRLDLYEITRHNRATAGVFALKESEKRGQIVGVVKVDDNSEYMLITDKGMLIRSPVNAVGIHGRQATGNILMRLNEDESVIGVQSISEDVVENSRKTAKARAEEKQALLAEQQRQKEPSEGNVSAEEGAAAEATAEGAVTDDPTGQDTL